MLPLFLFLLLITSGCGYARGEHKMLATADLIAPKELKSYEEVQTFREKARPKRSCVPTALLVANGNGYATVEDLEKTLRREAYSVQSDVLYIGQAGQTSSQIGTYGGGIAMGQTIYYPHLTGMACRTGAVWHGLRIDTSTGKDMVRYVYPDSPASKAGIQEGDELVTVNGIYMGDNEDAWQHEVNARPPLTPVDMQVLRAGSKQTIRMVLEAPREGRNP